MCAYPFRQTGSDTFLLSPAHAGGRRATALLDNAATFPLARRLQNEGAPLGEVFSFVSGLYFRGKLAYASRFGGPDQILVISTNRGLLPVSTLIKASDLRALGNGDISLKDETYRRSLARDVERLRGDRIVFLGSIATRKYLEVLGQALGGRLLVPRAFIGMGDMSRGSILLEAARLGQELAYMPAGEFRPAAMAREERAIVVTLPRDADDVVLTRGRARVHLTNLRKVFWPERKYTKRDLLQYYLDIAPVLLPHLKHRAMVMKRFPNGIHGQSFFMKRTPEGAPDWLRTCAITHAEGNVIAYPLVQDLPSLLWVVNLGCIDLNPWYSRCDDTKRPDYLHFDLDPVEGTPFARALEAALILRESLETVGMRPLVKTSGASGLHVYVALKRGPTQKTVWTVSKTLALEIAARHPRLMTTKFRVADRPRGTVLVDYNQNAWGRTLASVYSVRPTVEASVSTPLTWAEVEKGVAVSDFRIDNLRARVRRRGDLWKPMLMQRRFDLSRVA